MAKLIQYMTRESLYDGPFDSQVGWSAAGMGYVIVTGNGKLIVVDGGLSNDAEEFLKLVKAQSDSEVPEIELWVITHPHFDHYEALQTISKDPDMRGQLHLKKLVYWFPEEFCDKQGNPNCLAKENADMQEICDLMGAEPYRPARGDTFSFDDVNMEMLYVPDDCSILNTSNGNANLCSLIFTVKGPEKAAIITGDAYIRSLQVTAWRYAEKLKCDILQMPHHALCDAYCSDFYNYAEPKILLMPISVAGYRTMHTRMYEVRPGYAVNLCLEARAEKVYKAFEGTAELSI